MLFRSYGARKISKELKRRNICDFGRTHTKRLMDIMGIYPIYPKPKTSTPAKYHKKFPYLLRGKTIRFPNQVWATDITFLPLGHGHVYLSCIIDLYSRYIVGWRIHDTLEAKEACICMQKAFDDYGLPAISNSDQGSTYTSDEYIRSEEHTSELQSRI